MTRVIAFWAEGSVVSFAYVNWNIAENVIHRLIMLGLTAEMALHIIQY
jgi:hypothetical protein